MLTLRVKLAQKPGSNAVLGRRMGAKTVISPRKNVNGNAQNILTLSTRLREFMKQDELTRDEMAAVIGTPRGNIRPLARQ